MFNKTWRWAGKFRKSNKNIGVFWEQIPVRLKLLFDDVAYQIEKHVYELDELAARFHHRLVHIHPFPNGNGRHARLMSDILLFNQGAKRFTWGQENLVLDSQTKKGYINALRQADKHDYRALLNFVRT